MDTFWQITDMIKTVRVLDHFDENGQGVHLPLNDEQLAKLKAEILVALDNYSKDKE